MILSFSRAGGCDAQHWAQHLSKDYPHLAIYDVIFLESVPRLFRFLAVSNIRDGMPPTMQERTVLLYRDQAAWEQRLCVTDESHTGVILLKRDGDIQWSTSGPMTDSRYSTFERRLSAVK